MANPNDAVLYRWDDLTPDHPMPLLRRRRVVGEKAMISEILLHQGCKVATHAHENEQLAIVVRGHIRFGVGAVDDPNRRTIEATAGEVVVLPSNVPHSAYAIEETLILDVFSPPSERTGVDQH